MGRKRLPRLTFNDLPDLLTTTQVMWALNVSKRQVYLLLRSGTIRACSISKEGGERIKYRFFKEDIDKIRRRLVVYDDPLSSKEYAELKKLLNY
jgi:hypothetical protein